MARKSKATLEAERALAEAVRRNAELAGRLREARAAAAESALDALESERARSDESAAASRKIHQLQQTLRLWLPRCADDSCELCVSTVYALKESRA